jgi:hypothetical protein
MLFDKYQKVKRLGDDEVNGLLNGQCYVFPKLDGTNASVWVDERGVICCGSRTRQLSEEQDNHGFCVWVNEELKLQRFMHNYQHLRLCGEWLVPHSLKTYREEAWRRFYVFDVMNGDDAYVHPSDYMAMLQEAELDFIPCTAIINDPSPEQIQAEADRNTFMMQDGHIGEGVVVKNYDFVNKFGRRTWGKLVRNEFKEKNGLEFGPRLLEGEAQIEREIAERYVTQALVDKERAKIETSPIQPRLLQQVYHSIVVDDLWTVLKKHKNPTINFKRLQAHCTRRTKVFATDLFGG